MESTDHLLIEEYADASSFAGLSKEWDELLLNASSHNPFLTHQWQSVWWQNFSQGRSLKLIAVRSPNNTLVGLAPFYLEEDGEKIDLVGDQDLCDYQDMLLAQGREKDILRPMLCHLWESYGLPIYIHSLPASSPSLAALKSLAEEGICDLETAAQDTAPTLTLPSSFTEYLDHLNPRHRHELRRKLRKIEAQGSTALLRDESGSKLDVFIDLHKSSSSEKRGFMDERRQRFFRDITGAFSGLGWLSLLFLQFEGATIASLLCFNHLDSLYVYNSGYDPSYSSLSPGIVLLSYSIRDAIQHGIREFNLLRGDEAYKYHLGAQDLKLFTIWIRPRK